VKIIDVTLWHPPVIGGIKEKWLFQCDRCGLRAIFILWKGEGMSTGCEWCNGDMERKSKIGQIDGKSI